MPVKGFCLVRCRCILRFGTVLILSIDISCNLVTIGIDTLTAKEAFAAGSRPSAKFDRKAGMVEMQ